jgi:hypothetical protein
VILEQNHIAAGDKMLFPFGKSRKYKHFLAGDTQVAPTPIIERGGSGYFGYSVFR